MTHTHIDLFSGIGGFSLAFESEGFKTIAYSEINPDKILVYEHHFPGVPNLGDIKLIQGSDIRSTHGLVDVITGGVPCQPASTLGQMRGTADERWLWPETIRLVGQIRPRFGLFENPPSLIALNRGREWNGILSGFCALGYDCWWDVFPAAAFGAGHLRERVLLVVTDASERGWQEGPGLCKSEPTGEWSGRSGDASGEAASNSNSLDDGRRGCNNPHETPSWHQTPDGSAQRITAHADRARLQGHAGHGADGQGRAGTGRPAATPGLSESPANTDQLGCQERLLRRDRQTGTPTQETRLHSNQASPTSHPRKVEDLRGRVNSHNWWHEANTGVPVLAHGLPARLVEAAARCAGDSVVPQVIQPIAKAIKSALNPFSEE